MGIEPGIPPHGRCYKAKRSDSPRLAECDERIALVHSFVQGLPRGASRDSAIAALAGAMRARDARRMVRGNTRRTLAAVFGRSPIISSWRTKRFCAVCALCASAARSQYRDGRRPRLIAVEGQERTLAQWAAWLGVSRQALWKRAKHYPALNLRVAYAASIKAVMTQASLLPFAKRKEHLP